MPLLQQLPITEERLLFVGIALLLCAAVALLMRVRAQQALQEQARQHAEQIAALNEEKCAWKNGLSTSCAQPARNWS